MTDKYKQLINKLYEATKEKKISWDPTSRTNQYKTDLGKNSITIRKHESTGFGIKTNIEDGNYVVLAIWDWSGKEVDEIKGIKYSELNLLLGDNVNHSDDDFKLLEKLYQGVCESHTDFINATIDNILDSI